MKVYTCVAHPQLLIVADCFSRMLKKACELGSFRPVEVGKKKVHISHLQFADGSLLIGEFSKEKIEVIKSVLRWFALVSSLKINFRKSILVGFGCENKALEDWAGFHNCEVGSWTFNHLGVDVGWKAKDKKI